MVSVVSGKGGGFFVRDWGDGMLIVLLYKCVFELYETFAEELLLETYRKISTLSVLGGLVLDGGLIFFVLWFDGDI